MKTGTIKELAASYGVEDAQMNGAIHLLRRLGYAEVVGEMPKPAGTRGKAATIYKVTLEKKEGES